MNLELKNLNEDAFINSPHNILHLNVSNNLLSKGVDFLMFSSLRTLIIDNNHFSKLKGYLFNQLTVFRISVTFLFGNIQCKQK